MAAQYNPKTLAKTLSYIAYQAPAEYGLFWDPDGTMPWKELYWALQEDPSLRFVREGIVRELNYLPGCELPFALEGNLLRLRAGSDTAPLSARRYCSGKASLRLQTQTICLTQGTWHCPLASPLCPSRR